MPATVGTGVWFAGVAVGVVVVALGVAVGAVVVARAVAVGVGMADVGVVVGPIPETSCHKVGVLGGSHPGNEVCVCRQR